MNKLALLGLFGAVGSSVAFSPAPVGRAGSVLNSESTIATSPPITSGGQAGASLANIHPAFQMQADQGPQETEAVIQPDSQDWLEPVSMSDIRSQQYDVGLHAYSKGQNYKMNQNRN